MIHINKISIEGFRSIENLEFIFKGQGITFIQGLNGVGKSTLFEAVFYGLFGKAIKGTTLTEIPTKPSYRTENFKGTKVDLWFTVNNIDYRVIRHIAYGGNSSTELWCDGKPVAVQDKADAQRCVDNIINISPDLFIQSIFFAQKSLRIVDKKDADKREILDALFDIDLTDYILEAANKIKELDVQQAELVRNKAILDTKLLHTEQSLEVNSNILHNFNTDKELKLNQLRLEIGEYQKQIDIIPKDIVELVAPTPIDMQKYNTVLSHYVKTNSELSVVSDKLTSTKPIAIECIVCGSPLTSEKITKLTLEQDAVTTKNKEQKDLLEATLLNLSAELSALDLNKTNYAKEYQTYTEASLTYNAQIHHRDKLQALITQLEVQLNSLEISNCPISKVDIDNLKLTRIELTKNLDDITVALDTTQRDLGYYKFWQSEGFTSKGLKAYIMEAMLVRLNKALQNYGTLLGILVSINVKMESKLKSFDIDITSLDGVTKSYDEMSGGEQKRVDLIVSFALNDCIPTKVSLLILDEVFEGLDSVGLDIIMELLRNKSEEKGIYIITHDSKVDVSMASILLIKKHNNLTVIDN